MAAGPHRLPAGRALLAGGRESAARGRGGRTPGAALTHLAGKQVSPSAFLNSSHQGAGGVSSSSLALSPEEGLLTSVSEISPCCPDLLKAANRPAALRSKGAHE